MEYIITVAICIIFLILSFKIVIYYNNKKLNKLNNMTPVKNKYKYFKKDYIMTNRENEFYNRLEKIFGQKFYIFPQVHLENLLNHRIKGQNWKGALSKIQRKSVDYAIYRRSDMKLSFVIELDDSSHDSLDRKKRDMFIQKIFSDTDIKLVRFRQIKDISDKQIVEKIASSIRLDYK